MDPKPGYLTSEFWSTILVHLVTIVTLFNVNLNSDKMSALIPLGAFFMSGLAQAYYSHSRGHTKVASLTAAAEVLTTQAVVASNAPATTVPGVTVDGVQEQPL